MITRTIAAAALALTTASSVAHLTGTESWRSHDHCVSRERNTSIGWVEGRVCMSAGVSAQWSSGWLAGGSELAIMDVTTRVVAWKYSEGTKTWWLLQPRHIVFRTSEELGTSRDHTSFTCGWVNACSKYGVQRGAAIVREEKIAFKDCKTYHWHGDSWVTLDIPGAGKIFDGLRLTEPVNGAGTLAAEVCSP
jgi:hypothetical protein